MKHEQLNVIGLGGIGSWLFRACLPILNGDKREWHLQLVDGDKYEPKNAARQLFLGAEIGKNKAEANAYQPDFGRVRLSSFTQYVTAENLPRVITDRSTTLLCVDNHKTRKLVSDYVAGLNNAILISGGNDATDGNVQCMIRFRDKALTPALGDWHPEIAEPMDKHPEEVSCAELSAAGDGQTLSANLMAAAVMLNTFYRLHFTKQKLAANEFYFDTLQNSVVGKIRAKRTEGMGVS